jgi:hypothetical protein
MRISIILVILCFLQSAYAQKAASERTLMFSLDYISNALSQDNINGDMKQPTFSPMVAFLSDKGFEMFASAIFTGNSDDSMKNYTTSYDLGIAYSFKPLKNLTLYSGYTSSLFSEKTHRLLALFSNDLQIEANYDLRKYTLGITGGYLWGKQHTFYAMVRNHYQISVDGFLLPQSTLVIQPEIDFNFGSFDYLSKYYLKELSQYNGLYLYMIRHSSELRHYLAREIIRNPDANVRELVDHYLEEKTDDSFHLTSISLCLPFIYNFGNWGVNAGVYMILPIDQPKYLSDEVRFFMNIGLSYSLGVTRKQKE